MKYKLVQNVKPVDEMAWCVTIHLKDTDQVFHMIVLIQVHCT